MFDLFAPSSGYFLRFIFRFFWKVCIILITTSFSESPNTGTAVPRLLLDKKRWDPGKVSFPKKTPAVYVETPHVYIRLISGCYKSLHILMFLIALGKIKGTLMPMHAMPLYLTILSGFARRPRAFPDSWAAYFNPRFDFHCDPVSLAWHTLPETNSKSP